MEFIAFLHCCLILTKIGMCRHVLIFSYLKLNEYAYESSRYMWTDGWAGRQAGRQTDMTTLEEHLLNSLLGAFKQPTYVCSSFVSEAGITHRYGLVCGRSVYELCEVQSRPPLWSSGQSSWLQIQKSGFDSRAYQIFWEVRVWNGVHSASLSATEELFERKSSGSGLEIREYGHGDSLRWPRDTLYLQKLALTSPTSGCRSVRYSSLAD
jgi:hypothetical protein